MSDLIPIRKEREAVAFVLEFGAALHRVGTPAHRLEAAMEKVSELVGLRAQFFSTPTAIFAGFGDPAAQHTSLIRLSPGVVDLGRLARVDEIVNAVLARRVNMATGAAALRAVMAAPTTMPVLWTIAAHAVACGTGARFFGGGPKEMLIGTGLGLVVGGLERAMAKGLPAFVTVFVPAAAAIVAFLAAVATHLWAGVSSAVLILAGVLPLLPGLLLTNAMTEISTRHLTSGTARLTSAALIFVQLAFGVALGARLGSGLEPAGLPDPRPLPEWVDLFALCVSSFSYAVLFSALRRDWGYILAIGLVAYFTARFGSDRFGPELGAFLGALAVGAVANLYARYLDRPATVLVVPGILLLVPGSVGFRGVSSLLAQDATAGVNLAFSAALIAIALVAGLLIANTVVDPRKLL